MRAASRVAIGLAGLSLAACEGPRRSQSLWFNQVEVLAVRRNAESGLEPTDDDASMLGVTLLHYGDSHSTAAFELGARGGRFERAADNDTNYFETHAGVRWHPFGVEESVRPYLGLGLLWNGRGSQRDDFEVNGDRYEDEDSGNFFAVLGTWILTQAGPYATIGVDVSLGDLVLGAGVRAACADGVDLSARHPDDFALDVFASIGWSF